MRKLVTVQIVSSESQLARAAPVDLNIAALELVSFVALQAWKLTACMC